MMLGGWSITVGNPLWLFLIALIIPPLVWMSYRSLAGLGPVRRALAILLRTAVITLIILALAQLQSVRITDLSPRLPRRQVGIARHKDRYHSAAAKAFVATALEVGAETSSLLAA